ncbi:hypothetical protein BV20DRAFT_1094260 [Pilatotrama ljubarskyi]|nr:hypothetical protein BV20DRAFT_1094260 [Pilatotrama ljubarskyi]
MSISAADALEIASAVNSEAFVAAIALYCFDYSLTLAREVERIWKLGFSVPAVIFHCVRYSALVNILFVILDQTPWKGISDMSCSIIVHFEIALNMVLLVAAAVFSALRAYALSWQDARVLVVVLVLGLVHPAIVLGCGFSPSISPALYENWVLADLVVVVITVANTWSLRVQAARISFRSQIMDILMRDGAIYFSVLLVANLVGLALVRSFTLIQPMSTFIATLTAIMTSRFILDLHDAADVRAGETSLTSRAGGNALSATRLPDNLRDGSIAARRAGRISIVFGGTSLSTTTGGAGSEWRNGDDGETANRDGDGEARSDSLPESGEGPRCV